MEIEENEGINAEALRKWDKEMSMEQIDSCIMNKLVMDYLVRAGFKQAAEKFGEEAGVAFSPIIENLEEKTLIRDAVLIGDIKTAIKIINTRYPEMLDKDRLLLFELQLQQFIELIRLKKVDDALIFAQENLSEISEENPECLPELERVMSLLVFEKPEESNFKDLLEQTHRHQLWRSVNGAFLELQNETRLPRLANIVEILHWSQEALDNKKIVYRRLNNPADPDALC